MLRKKEKMITMAEKYPVATQVLIFCILHKMYKEKPSHPGYKMITWFVADRTESVNTFSDVFFSVTEFVFLYLFMFMSSMIRKTAVFLFFTCTEYVWSINPQLIAGKNKEHR